MVFLSLTLYQQTLELIQQERVGLSSKLSEKRAYYSKVAEDMNAKLQKQQEWVSSTRNISRELQKHDLVTGKVVGEISKAEGMALYFSVVFDTTFYEKGLLNSTKTFRRIFFFASTKAIFLKEER
ncbi:uncharacterized protein LOC114170750 [Vigna unguiculata]|uniref:uncharacterized protein LOC114170750 n=1 Tax=Vigna unguiculata TaxID=3917 RepID=UPI0010166C79|nr:uncharacterized protein LOC114170750 [Vigna unguiculata]